MNKIIIFSLLLSLGIPAYAMQSQKCFAALLRSESKKSEVSKRTFDFSEKKDDKASMPDNCHKSDCKFYNDTLEYGYASAEAARIGKLIPECTCFKDSNKPCDMTSYLQLK